MPVIAEHLGINPNRIVFTGNDVLPAVGALGFEIELEGIHGGNWPRNIEGWARKDDGSLRNGKEYIFNGPQSGDEALASLRAMASRMAEVGVDPTFRCSTHVHLDVRDFNWDQYERTILLYMVFEDMFFDHCQPYRRHSNFCVPFQSNDWLSQYFGQRVIGCDSFAHKFAHLQSWPKYSGLNLQVTTSFGSIEFRGSHATVDEAELIGLAQRMLYLKKFVVEDESADHYEFLAKVATKDVSDVFPVGLREGYTMEDGAMAQGLSTAYHALAIGGLARVAQDAPQAAPPPPRNGEGNPVVREDISRNINMCLRSEARWDSNELLKHNIQTVTGAETLLGGLRMLAALNSLYATEQVKLSDVMTGYNPEYYAYLRTNVGYLATFNGLGGCTVDWF